MCFGVKTGWLSSCQDRFGAAVLITTSVFHHYLVPHSCCMTLTVAVQTVRAHIRHVDSELVTFLADIDDFKFP